MLSEISKLLFNKQQQQHANCNSLSLSLLLYDRSMWKFPFAEAVQQQNDERVVVVVVDVVGRVVRAACEAAREWV